jgi:hypothetical protein
MPGAVTVGASMSGTTVVPLVVWAWHNWSCNGFSSPRFLGYLGGRDDCYVGQNLSTTFRSITPCFHTGIKETVDAGDRKSKKGFYNLWPGLIHLAGARTLGHPADPGRTTLGPPSPPRINVLDFRQGILVGILHPSFRRFQ